MEKLSKEIYAGRLPHGKGELYVSPADLTIVSPLSDRLLRSTFLATPLVLMAEVDEGHSEKWKNKAP